MIRRRFKYANYDDYLAWQAQKSARMLEKLLAKRAERVRWFAERFVCFVPASALCLGARFGEEVEALRSLGWTARGIDLAPFSPWVDVGDMNEPPPGKFDLIYTNAFDHCWQPQEFLKNCVAALAPGGRLMMHIASGKPGAFETVEWDDVQDVAALLPGATVHTIPLFYGLDTEIIYRA